MTYAGIWLDHKKAVVVKRTQEKETSDKILSGLSPRNKARHAARLAPKKQEERREHLISQFYLEVFKALKGVDKVLLVGPGLAKKEFKKFIAQKRFSGKVVETESSDKMTDRQLAAQTRKFFNLATSF